MTRIGESFRLMKYIIEKDQTVRRTVLERYREAILKLRSQGFTAVACYAEKTSPFSLIALWPMAMLMRRKSEYVKLLPDLSFKAVYPLMVERGTATFALINSLGTKLTTRFLDGTVLISNTMNKQAYVWPDEQFYKYHVEAGDDVWAFPQGKIAAFVAEGKPIAPGIQFGDYVQGSSREDDVLEPTLIAGLANSVGVRVVLFLVLTLALRELVRLIVPWIGQVLISGG